MNKENGWVYVVDQGNNRIQRFSSRLVFLDAWGSQRSGEGQFQTPGDIAVGPGGNWVYVLDKGNRRVQRFSSRGTFSLEWGKQGNGQGQFQAPSAIVIDESGFLYIGDIEVHRVQKLDDRGNFQWEAVTAVPDGG